MAKRVIQIDEEDYNDALMALGLAIETLQTMRKSKKRDLVERHINMVAKCLTKEDDIDMRVNILECRMG